MFSIQRCLGLQVLFLAHVLLSLCQGMTLKETSLSLIKERGVIPTGWIQRGSAHRHHILNLRIALKQENPGELERRLDKISDPEHELYGQHLSAAEIQNLAQPSQQTIRSVTEWLSLHRIGDYTFSPYKDWISVSLPVQEAEELLNTTYREYTRHYENSGDTLVRALEWYLPDYLHDAIDTIQPTTSFLRLAAQGRRGEPPEPEWFLDGRLPTYAEMVEEDLLDRGHIDVPDQAQLPENPTSAQACNRLAISPFCVRTLYGTLGYTAAAPEKNGIGLVNYNGQSNNRTDLQLFLDTYRKDAAQSQVADTFKTEIVNGGRDQQTQLNAEQLSVMMDFEGALDIQTVIGNAFPTPVTAYNVGGKPPVLGDKSSGNTDNEPYLDWLHYLSAQDDIPPVITTSYADIERTVPEGYARRVCNEFAKLGARGVSVIFASGDHGVGRDPHCTSADNDGSTKTRFAPVFPATCPYVTSVGATRLVGPEIVGFDARGGFVSGGGFSEYFPRPRYQESHVKQYLRGLDETLSPYFNGQGRGYPDVSMIGYHYAVVWNGTAHLQDGTSASAPAFAALVALINDALLAAGKPSLGFLNPLLYSRGVEGFTDITIGSNFGCNTTGFPARQGWDAASGLGTPFFPKLKEIALGYRYRAQKPWYLE